MVGMSTVACGTQREMAWALCPLKSARYAPGLVLVCPLSGSQYAVMVAAVAVFADVMEADRGALVRSLLAVRAEMLLTV